MIRFTEQGRKGQVVEGKLEGQLEQEDLATLLQLLKVYEDQGIQEICLRVDELLPADPLSGKALGRLCQGAPRVRFCSASGFRRELLAGYGLEVESSG